MERKSLLLLLLGTLLVALPFALHVFYQLLAVTAILWILLALSFNTLVGDLGELSFGHAAFYGIGAYASALTVMRLGVPVPAGVLAGALVAGMTVFLVGIPAFQTKGHYFALVTMGFGQLVVLVMTSWENLTGGAIGLRNIPSLGLGDDLRATYLAFLVIFALVLGFLYRLRSSHVGEAFDAIREDTFLAESIGIPAKRYKLLGFFFSCAIAGLAGGLMAHLYQYVSPLEFDLSTTLTIALMTLAGGAGTLWGPIVGALFLHLVPETMHAIDTYRTAAYGLILMLLIIFLPGGLASLTGLASGALRRLAHKGMTTTEPKPATREEGGSG